MYSQQRSRAVKLDALPSSHVALILILFLLVYPIGFLLGRSAPVMYKEQAIEHLNEEKANSTTWSGILHGVDRINEQFFLEATLSNEKYRSEGITKHISVDTSLDARNAGEFGFRSISSDLNRVFHIVCPENQKYCRGITLLREYSIEYAVYKATVSLRGLVATETDKILFVFKYINGRFSLLALCVKYALLTLSASVAWWYYHAIERTNEMWSTSNKMVMSLLFALILFNDPVYILRVTLGGPLYPVISLFCQTVFLAVAVVFTLDYLDRILVNLQRLNSLAFAENDYVSVKRKIAVFGVLWLGCVVGLIFIRVNESEDPMYRPTYDFKGFLMYKVGSFALLVVTILWFGYIVVRITGETTDIRRSIRSVRGESSTELDHLVRRFKVITICTTTFLSYVCVSLTLWYLGLAPLPGNNTPEWLGFVLYINAFVFITAYCNFPLQYSALPSSSHHDDL